MEQGRIKKINVKRKHYEIENYEDGKSINLSKNRSQNESQQIENLSKFRIRKRILKFISEDKIGCAWFSIYSPNYAFSTSILMLKTSIFDPVP